MPGPFVIDSSALAKTFLVESETAALLDWIRERLQGGDDLLSPTLIAYELGEVARQKGGEDGQGRLRVVEAALRLVRLVNHETILSGAFEIDRDLSFYDAAFASLTQGTGATLVTYDRRLLEFARRAGQRCISPGRE